jgi:hypothetical protein
MDGHQIPAQAVEVPENRTRPARPGFGHRDD